MPCGEFRHPGRCDTRSPNRGIWGGGGESGIRSFIHSDTAQGAPQGDRRWRLCLVCLSGSTPICPSLGGVIDNTQADYKTTRARLPSDLLYEALYQKLPLVPISRNVPPTDRPASPPQVPLCFFDAHGSDEPVAASSIRGISRVTNGIHVLVCRAQIPQCRFPRQSAIPEIMFKPPTHHDKAGAGNWRPA